MHQTAETILKYMRDYQGKYGMPPSFDEIAFDLDLSKSIVKNHLRVLERDGLIGKYDDSGFRSARNRFAVPEMVPFGTVETLFDGPRRRYFFEMAS